MSDTAGLAHSGTNDEKGQQGSPVPHAYDRWVAAVLAGCGCACDPRTLAIWAKAVGVSGSWLKAWCYAARVGPKPSLDFTRVLRAVLRGGGDIDLLNMFDVADERTLQRILARGHVTTVLRTAGPLSAGVIIASQRFVTNSALLARLEKRLADSSEVHGFVVGRGQ